MGPTILFADGAEEARTAAVSALEASGFTVLSASNGREALWMAEQCRPDMLVADIDLPEIDGIALAWHIRAWFPGIAIILMSSDLGETELAAMRPLYDTLLLRPVSPWQLAELASRRFRDPARPRLARAGAGYVS